MLIYKFEAYFFDYGMSFVGGPIAWRLPIACQMIFCFVSLSSIFCVGMQLDQLTTA